jgi:superfamily II DNA or RNA helicase
MIKLEVQRMRFNKGRKDEYTTTKCVLNLEEAKAELSSENYDALMSFIKVDNTCEIEKFNGMKDRYNEHIEMKKRKLLIMPRFMFQRLSKYFTENNIQYEVLHKSHPSLETLMKYSKRSFGKLKKELYSDKLRVIDTIMQKLRSDHGLIVKLDTGKGKSIIISEITRQMGLLTNIVTKDSTLQRQMFNDLHANLELDCIDDCLGDCMKTTGVSRCKYIALLGGTKSASNTRLLESHDNYKILISIINSAKEKDSTYWMKFGLTIFDECHNYTSERNSEIYKRSQTQYMLGLSATPTKRWNHMMIEHNIGEIVDFDPYIEDSVKLKGVVYKVNYRGSYQYTKMIKNKCGVMSVAKMVKQFMEDNTRSELIIDIIAEAVLKHKHGFVFAMVNDYLYDLKERLDKKYPEITSVILCSSTSTEDKEVTMKNVNVIFTNYSFSEGVNIVHTRFQVIASPYKGNGRQITGRILRDRKDDVRYFYDIIDVNTKLSSQFEEREQVYLERGFEIVDYKK